MARTADHIRKRKLARDEEYREKLAVGIRLGQLFEIYEELRKIGMGEKKLKGDTANATLGALKTAADIQFKAMAKLIPDLKAIEHSGTLKVDKPPEEQYKEDLATLKDAGLIIEHDQPTTH